MGKLGILLILALAALAVLWCVTKSRSNFQALPAEPASCRWLAEQMYEGGADERLVNNARDLCLNYHTLCGNSSAGAEVLSIYDNYGNNWDVAVDVLAQDMDVAGKDKTQCISPLTCDPKRAKCPAYLSCVNNSCQ